MKDKASILSFLFALLPLINLPAWIGIIFYSATLMVLAYVGGLISIILAIYSLVTKKPQKGFAIAAIIILTLVFGYQLLFWYSAKV